MTLPLETLNIPGSKKLYSKLAAAGLSREQDRIADPFLSVAAQTALAGVLPAFLNKGSFLDKKGAAIPEKMAEGKSDLGSIVRFAAAAGEVGREIVMNQCFFPEKKTGLESDHLVRSAILLSIIDPLFEKASEYFGRKNGENPNGGYLLSQQIIGVTAALVDFPEIFFRGYDVDASVDAIEKAGLVETTRRLIENYMDKTTVSNRWFDLAEAALKNDKIRNMSSNLARIAIADAASKGAENPNAVIGILADSYALDIHVALEDVQIKDGIASFINSLAERPDFVPTNKEWLDSFAFMIQHLPHGDRALTQAVARSVVMMESRFITSYGSVRKAIVLGRTKGEASKQPQLIEQKDLNIVYDAFDALWDDLPQEEKRGLLSKDERELIVLTNFRAGEMPEIASEYPTAESVLNTVLSETRKASVFSSESEGG